MNFEDLTVSSSTSQNIGGTTDKIYFVDINDVTSEAAIPDFDAAASLEDAVTIAGNHTLASGKKFSTLTVEMDSGELMAKLNGERGGKSLATEADFMYPRFTPASLGFAKKAANARFIVLIPLPGGQVIQIGCKDFPAEIEPEVGTGKNASGVRCTKGKIKSLANSIFFYTGSIDLTA